MTKADHFRFIKSPLSFGSMCTWEVVSNKVQKKKIDLMSEAMGIAQIPYPSYQGKYEMSNPYFCDIK